MALTSTSKQISSLKINKVPSEAIYAKMVAQNLINDDELYLISGEADTITGVKGNKETTYRTGNINLTPADIGALPDTTEIPVVPTNISAFENDAGYLTQHSIPSVGNGTLTIQKNGTSAGTFTANATTNKTINITVPTKVSELTDDVVKGKYLSLTGGTMTGKLTVPQVETGDGNSNFFQCRKFRGEGNADTYYHAIDFGYKNHDRVDFHEYGGIWNFFKNTSGKANEGSLCGKITTNGWEGGAKLIGSPTAPTPGTSDNSTRIATTAFVNSFNSTKLESNGDGSNVTAAFTAASSRTNISTGEKLSVIFGKIAKFFSDLKTVAFTGSYNDLSDKPTIPTAVTVDSAMSTTSTNPVQNKVIKAELDKKAASSHNQAAGTITAGTFAGAVVASASNQAPGTSLLRNSKLVSSDTTPTVNGEIFWTYG